MMGRPDERHKTMRPQIVPPPPATLSCQAAQFANWVWAKHSCKKKTLEQTGKIFDVSLIQFPIKESSPYCLLVVKGGLLWDCLPGFNPILKIIQYYLVKTWNAIDNILQRNLDFFSHLCLPVGSVGGGRVSDEPASTLPSLSSSLNKGVPAFQKIVGCFRFYTAR